MARRAVRRWPGSVIRRSNRPSNSLRSRLAPRPVGARPAARDPRRPGDDLGVGLGRSSDGVGVARTNSRKRPGPGFRCARRAERVARNGLAGPHPAPRTGPAARSGRSAGHPCSSSSAERRRPRSGGGVGRNLAGVGVFEAPVSSGSKPSAHRLGHARHQAAFGLRSALGGRRTPRIAGFGGTACRSHGAALSHHRPPATLRGRRRPRRVCGSAPSARRSGSATPTPAAPC